MAEVIPADSVSPPFREKRLGHDLRGLIGDSPEGTYSRTSIAWGQLELLTPPPGPGLLEMFVFGVF